MNPAAFFGRNVLALRTRVLTLAVFCGVWSLAAAGDLNKEISFDIPAQPLSQALVDFSRQADTNVAATTEITKGKTSKAVKETTTPAKALQRLLEGTHLQYRVQGDGAIVVEPSTATAGTAPVRISQANTPSFSSAAVEYQAGHDEEKVEKLDEIVVTAQKREERIMDVPLSISAFTNRAMQDSGARQLSDFLASAPGVGIVNNEGGQGSSIQIRGINSTFGAALVGYYLDELPFSLLDNNYTPDVRTYDLERVEVLRGPQGTLYGDGSLGGVVRILTRDPDLHAWQGNVDLSGSDTQGGDGSYAAKGMINVPVKDEVLALRLVATKEDNGGWIDNTATGVDDQNYHDIVSYRVKLRYAPTDNLDIVLSDWVDRDDSRGGSLALADETNGTIPFVRSTDYELYSATLRYRFAAFDLLSATSKMHYTEDGRSSLFGLPFIIFARNDVVSEELRLTSNSTGIFRWTAGAFYRDMDQDSDFQIFGGSYPSLGSSESYAVFGEGTWAALDRKLEVTLGLRYFKDNREDNSPVSDALLEQIHAVDPAFVPGASPSFDSVSPRVNLAYHLNDRWLAYTNVAKGFRSGRVQGVASLAQAALTQVKIPAGVDPETLWSYEIGTKGTAADGRVQLEAAVYYNDWKDLQVNAVLDGSGLSGILSGGKARTMGVELGATFLPIDGLLLRISGSRLSAKYREDVPGTPIRDGDRVSQVPNTSLSAEATYRWPLTAALGGFVHGSAQYTSDRVYPLDITVLPSEATTLVDLRFGVEGKVWGAYVFVDNATNEDRPTDVAFSSNLFAANRPRPRTIGLNVRYDFQ